jgi:hypothetical protein
LGVSRFALGAHTNSIGVKVNKEIVMFILLKHRYSAILKTIDH